MQEDRDWFGGRPRHYNDFAESLIPRVVSGDVTRLSISFYQLAFIGT